MEGLVGALVMAVLALPAVGMAAWFARDPRPASATVALHLALVGIVMLLSALGLYFLRDDEAAVGALAILLLVAVNALVVSLLWRMRRFQRGGRR